MTALYNEIDPFAAAWLRELIAGGHIAPGIVVETSIEDLTPNDLRPFHQVHLFAGIGVWSYALRRIGWPDDRPIWTGSCPCQPFSAAGKGNGFADERHLWPHFFHLITQCRPAVVVGEQVASKDGLAWLDLVQADMEGAGHAFGAVDLCAAGVGAPHIRQRLWWVGKRLADTDGGNAGAEWQQCGGEQRQQSEDGGALFMEHAPSDGREQGVSHGAGYVERVGPQRELGRPPEPDDAGGMDHHHPRLEGQRGGYQTESGRVGEVRPVAEAGELSGVADAAEFGRLGRRAGETGDEPGTQQRSDGLRHVDGLEQPGGERWERREETAPGHIDDRAAPLGSEGEHGSGEPGAHRVREHRTGPTNGLWRDADWLFCRDGKWRPVEPGTFPLVNGAAARVGRLRGYGNAIVAPVAEEFLRAALLDELVNSAV